VLKELCEVVENLERLSDKSRTVK